MKVIFRFHFYNVLTIQTNRLNKPTGKPKWIKFSSTT